MLRYDEFYYQDIVERFGYKFCNEMTDLLPGFSFDEMQNWLCGYNLNTEVIHGISKENTLIILGVGTNHEPHIGTISQILRGIYFQKRGYKVQIILGDIDSYSSRSSSITSVTKNVEKYANFVKNLGFDANFGTIRNQLDHAEIMKTAFLISPKVQDEDFQDVEESIYQYYEKLGIYSGMSFAVKQAILLMFSDFIHEGFVGNYKNIIVLSGIDEHPYVPKANDIAGRLDLDVNICGLFSSIIRGLNGQPKMSKSLRGSSITAGMTEREIIKIITRLPEEAVNHNDSIAYQLMCHVLLYDNKTLNTLAKHCDSDPVMWAKDKVDFAHDLSLICEKWDK
ncbi:hypothetical protein IKF26_02560 [Candidatus Saccharibacteria bacterium]|nr:hypothetical protein [Candidatus Saccharibacteria bacterium]